MDEEFELLLDPEWLADGDDEDPPFEAVIGMWPRQPDGTTGRFRSNPEYLPRYADSPSDPIDALLRLALAGDAEMAQLQAVLRDSLVDLAMNGDGRPLVDRSPDDVPCLIVTTSAPHRRRVSAPGWRQVALEELLAILAADGEALFNPGGPAPVRMSAGFLHETLGEAS